jgi:hypothetical protein
MSTEAEAQVAISKLDNQPFEGRRLTVNVAKPQVARSGGSRERGFGGGQRRVARW